MTVSNTVKDTEKAKEGHTQQKAREKEITINCSALCAKYVLSLLFDFFHFANCILKTVFLFDRYITVHHL